MNEDTILIGIDGGGTKTEAVLSDRYGHVLARRIDGPSNPNDVTLAASASVLTRLTEAVLADVGLKNAYHTVSLFVGVAGGLNHGPALTEALRCALPALGAVAVSSDVTILLSSELPEGDGACLVCGTGSACFLRIGNAVTRIGGWGYLLDSGGGGYHLGRDALEAVLMAHDGRGPATALTNRLAAHYGDAVPNLITPIYREGKPYIASCAPCVFEAAFSDRDAVAAAILERNARALAAYIDAAYVKWSPRADTNSKRGSLPVILGGSISRHRPAFVAQISSLLAPETSATLRVAEAPAVLGALFEARHLLGNEASVSTAAFSDRFSKTYACHQ